MNPIFRVAKHQNLGNCQVNYVTHNPQNQKIYYCLQDNGERFGGIRLMRCTQEFEPEYECKFKNGINAVFEKPKITEYDSEYTIKLKNLCAVWINKNHGADGAT